MDRTDHPSSIFKLDKVALVVGILGIIGLIAGAVMNPTEFFRGYLVGYIFWFMITIGSLGILMLQYLTGGMWAFVIRRATEAAAKNLPLMFAAFLPLIVGIPHLYMWADHAKVEKDHLLHSKVAYLNTPFWIARGIFFFLIWMAFWWFIKKKEEDYQERPSHKTALSLRHAGAFGLVTVALTLTFASVDWVMSLDPYWYSTMFGISFIVGCLLGAMALAVAFTAKLSDHPPLSDLVEPGHFRDLGNLMFAFIMLWAYTAFSQFLLIWYGNIKEEIPYYIIRSHGVWGVAAVLLIVVHFFVPFFLLLLRGVKERARAIFWVAIVVLLMRVVDLHWVISPMWSHGHEFHMNWFGLISILGIGGIWMFLFIRSLASQSLVPARASHMEEEEALSHG